MPRYIYGHDPASKDDFYGLVIHRIDDWDPNIPEDRRPAYMMPKLQTLRGWRNFKWLKLRGWLFGKKDDVMGRLPGLYQRFPPFYQVVDYTNEKSWAEELQEKFGEHRVEAISFTRQNKLMLKQAGLKIMQLGYAFPTLEKLPEVSEDPQGYRVYLRALVYSTIEQLRHEQIVITPSGQTSFDHPEGEKNDLAIGWELSVYGCLKQMLQGHGLPVAYGRKVKPKRTYDFEQDPETVDKYVPELKRVGVRINNISVRDPPGSTLL